jgi:RNA polymerase sigma factor (sigma-70 family)
MNDFGKPPARDPEAWSPETLQLRRTRADDFAPTPKGLVERARLKDQDAEAALFRLYWQPVHGFLRRKGAGPDEAGDVTQRYFESVHRRRDLTKLEPQLSFRSWLRTGAKRQLLNWRAEQRLRTQRVEEAAIAKASTEVEPPDAERLLRRQRVLDLLDLVWQRLAATYEAAGERQLFEHLRLTICDERSITSDAELCQELGVSKHYVAQRRLRLRTKEFPDALAVQVGSRSKRDDIQALLDDLE